MGSTCANGFCEYRFQKRVPPPSKSSVNNILKETSASSVWLANRVRFPASYRTTNKSFMRIEAAGYPKKRSTDGARRRSRILESQARSSLVKGSVTRFKSVVGYVPWRVFCHPTGSSNKPCGVVVVVVASLALALPPAATRALRSAARVAISTTCWHSAGVKSGAWKTRRGV